VTRRNVPRHDLLEERAMEQPSGMNAADDRAHIDDLRADLAAASEHLARLTG
jgi:hypothetical protein